MPPYSPCAWMNAYCPLLDGQFVFLDPVWWNTHLLSEGAVQVLREASIAIESGRFSDFLEEVEVVGGWPPGLQSLAEALAHLQSHQDRCTVSG